MATPDSLLTSPAATISRPDRVFPTLTPAQIARVAVICRGDAVLRNPSIQQIADCVASAVGEGSIAVAFVHQVLQQERPSLTWASAWRE
jgi:hypothetical protein